MTDQELHLRKLIDNLENKLIQKIDEENAALRADKERLDWLLMQSCWLLHNYDWNEKITSREDIDAARKGEAK